jgi:hypothetical protein
MMGAISSKTRSRNLKGEKKEFGKKKINRKK